MGLVEGGNRKAGAGKSGGAGVGRCCREREERVRAWMDERAMGRGW